MTPMKLSNITLGLLFAVLLIALLFLGASYLEDRLSDRDDRLVELYLMHQNHRTDTIHVPAYYKVPEIQVKLIEKPVVVKEYLKDTLARSELERKTLILSQKYKLNLVGKTRNFSVATIDINGVVRENFYKVPILTKEIKIGPSGEVEFKKRKLIALKIATGLTAGFFTYQYIHKK